RRRWCGRGPGLGKNGYGSEECDGERERGELHGVSCWATPYSTPASGGSCGAFHPHPSTFILVEKKCRPRREPRAASPESGKGSVAGPTRVFTPGRPPSGTGPPPLMGRQYRCVCLTGFDVRFRWGGGKSKN